MGQPKAWLPFGDETLLQLIVRTVNTQVAPLVVSAAEGQDLPPLPDEVEIVRDELSDRGPMGGLSVALAHLSGRAEAAFVTSCDTPLLKPAVIRQLIATLGDADAVIPRQGRWHHPLTAVYRVSLAARCRELVQREQLRMLNLVDGARVEYVDVESLRGLDPGLQSFTNANTPQEYAALVALARTADKTPAE